MTPRPSFDRLAPAYQILERLTFGGLLHWCRTAHLARFHDCRRALILGDGDGRFLADLVRAHPNIEVDSMDISPGMLALAHRRVTRIPAAANRVRFIHADARTDPLPARRYDLVVTNFFLDCFPAVELAAVVRRVTDVCDSDAIWVDGDFRLPSSGWPRVAARGLLAGMYCFFRLTTRLTASELSDATPHLKRAGFTLGEEVTRLRGFLSARLWIRRQVPGLQELMV